MNDTQQINIQEIQKKDEPKKDEPKFSMYLPNQFTDSKINFDKSKEPSNLKSFDRPKS